LGSLLAVALVALFGQRDRFAQNSSGLSEDILDDVLGKVILLGDGGNRLARGLLAVGLFVPLLAPRMPVTRTGEASLRWGWNMTSPRRRW